MGYFHLLAVVNDAAMDMHARAVAGAPASSIPSCLASHRSALPNPMHLVHVCVWGNVFRETVCLCYVPVRFQALFTLHPLATYLVINPILSSDNYCVVCLSCLCTKGLQTKVPLGFYFAYRALPASGDPCSPDLLCVTCLLATDPLLCPPFADDVLTKDAGECVICLEELLQGDTIARLPCLCIYHKRYERAARASSAPSEIPEGSFPEVGKRKADPHH